MLSDRRVLLRVFLVGANLANQNNENRLNDFSKFFQKTIYILRLGMRRGTIYISSCNQHVHGLI